jgi:hypothetical protein
MDEWLPANRNGAFEHTREASRGPIPPEPVRSPVDADLPYLR